ncbi:MAG: FkbM family methyltransferase [Caldimonas sp.]
MRLYERLAAHLIGTPLQKPAEWLRRLKGTPGKKKHPELAEIYAEEGRIDEVLGRVIGPGTHCIDIGCHLGVYLQKLVTLAPQGRHWAFEPMPEKAKWLKRKYPHVSVLQMALGDSTGSASFFVCEQQTAYSGLAPRDVHGPNRPVQVERRTLDDVVPDDAGVGFIKLDVNGGELAVLRGARKLLLRDRPIVLLGCTQQGLSDYGASAEEVHRFVVDEVGYGIYLPKDFLAAGEPLSAKSLRNSMQYPFDAFNYVLEPEGVPAQGGAGQS